mgnify:CR=1
GLETGGSSGSGVGTGVGSFVGAGVGFARPGRCQSDATYFDPAPGRARRVP